MGKIAASNPPCCAVSCRYVTVIPSSASSIEHRSIRRPGRYDPKYFHTATRRSCNELNWSRFGKQSCNQYHWITAASSSDVGVSALYSSSFGGSTPLYARSKRPYSDGGSASHELSISGTA